ncbi:MAG: S41 family peptidase [Ignavibacteriaceae bacterium]
MKKLVFLIYLLVILSGNIISQPIHSFIAAFDSLHQNLSTYYAFTNWKNINWKSLYSEFQPRVAAAESNDDSSAFLMAMKEYTFRIPDGHIGLQTGLYPYAGIDTTLFEKKHTNWVRLENNLRNQQIGGSYGFTLIKLDDGRFVVRLVTAGSPADSAGIKFGATMLEINDQPIGEAIDSVSVVWAEQIPATNETTQLQQCRMIGRAPVRTTIKVEFENKGDVTPTTINLTAVNDNYATYNLTSMLPILSPQISNKILQPSGYGYLQITSCIPPTSVVTDFMNAFAALLADSIKGLVVDLRINTGGQDFFAAAVAGCFYSDTSLYEYQSFYDPTTSAFQISNDTLDYLDFAKGLYKASGFPSGSLYIVPQALVFKGPVVVMVSPRNVSSGEGIAMALQKLPQCKVVSFYGSFGSFGILAADMNLLSIQDSLELSYPNGRSLDVNKKIQVDSDSNKIGGVIPDIRPPLNDQTIDQLYTEGIDVELEYAVQELDKMNGIEGIKNEKSKIPVLFALYQNYPNPFNPTTTINYSIPKASLVTIKVYDILGRVISTLVNGEKSAGNYSVQFSAIGGLSSGVYFYRMQAGGFVQTKKLLLLK